MTCIVVDKNTVHAKPHSICCYYNIKGSCVVYEPLDRDVGRHLDRYVGRHIGRGSTDMSVEMSADSRPMCRSRYVGRHVADDTNITVAADSLTELESKINLDLKNLNRWLLANRLSLSVAKTEFMVIGSHQRVRASGNEEINVEISGKSITRVDKVKSLGLLIDEQLTWKDHVDETVKKISKAIGALKRARPFISVKTAVQIYHALIRPYFDYCSSVWGECTVYRVASV